MKRLKIICICLLCLLLAGCSGPATGDMEKALTALKWEDYDTAIAESTAYLKRVPDSGRAQTVRETAAWAKVFNKLEDTSLSYGMMDVGYQTDVSSSGSFDSFYGLSITDIHNAEDDSFSLVAFSIHTSSDSEFFSADVNFASQTTSYIELEWEDNAGYYFNKDHTTTIYNTEALSSETLREVLPSEIDTEFADYLQSVFPGYLEELFEYIEQQTDVKPADLGFAGWE